MQKYQNSKVNLHLQAIHPYIKIIQDENYADHR